MAKLTFLQFLCDQFLTLPLITADLTGRVVIVIGANGGIGLEATRHLASMNPERLILGCRSVERGEAAVKDINASTGCTAMEVWQIDLASFASVRAFADRFEKEGGGELDLLISNAGIATHTFTPTVDKYERTLQINHLSTSLLALRLLPYLSKSGVKTPGPRIVFVTSELHYYVSRLSEADKDNIIHSLNDPATAKMEERYPTSKLLNLFFTRAVAKHLKGHKVAITCCNPGFCHSGLTREATGLLALCFKVIKALIARTPEMGSRALVAAALAGADGEVHGRYMNKCEVEEESDYAIGEESGRVQQRLWDETVAILEDVDPHVRGIVNNFGDSA